MVLYRNYVSASERNRVKIRLQRVWNSRTVDLYTIGGLGVDGAEQVMLSGFRLDTIKFSDTN